jgi:GWxTD domain-containing protein
MMKTDLFSRINRLIIISGFLAVVAMSCKTTQPVIDSKDLSYLYNPTKNRLNPRYNITNQSEDKSVIAIKFFASELFFSEANPQGVPTAMMLITVKLYSTTHGRVLADTSYLSINIVREEGMTEYICTIPLSVKPGIEYLAEVKVLDRQRSMVVQAFVPFNTLSDNNRYNFLARGYLEKNEIFNPVIRINEYIGLKYLKGHIDTLFVSYYHPLKEIPDPPSMLLPEKTIDYGPDTIVPLPYSDTLPMMFPKEGVYLCTTGRDIKEGYSLFNYGATYPEMNTPEVMIEPLGYIASADEMNEMRSSAKPKVALDEFWIKSAGNVDKARELIRIYYTRVLYANYYFTSFKEGWRTERGMIYIVYGPPDKVYKSSEGEAWGYRKPVIKSSWGYRYKVKEEYLFFNFRKRENIFTDNDFYLSRSETLVTLWDKAVASWKSGIVFRLDNPQEI